ncbi:MAG: UDP-N-acetylmuramoyl-L-alanine--D-glutamate ligase [Vicinamibacteria bacterium]|nr:UDP-N-acetylmuramoyl-L-alanine--D-glutamate ligase [Vicinamibacteria bacterium]
MSATPRRALVVGLARSGVAAAELLLAEGASVTVTDLQPEAALADRAARLRSAGARLELGGHVRQSFEQAALVVVSPGVPWDHADLAAARAAGALVIGELELFARRAQGPVTAVTGSKGKSTTTAALGAMLREAFPDVRTGGNLGAAACGLLTGHDASTRFVIEVSSFQLEAQSSLHPRVAVFLNLSADHLERHGTLAVYAQAKARLFARQTPDDWAVVGADDPQVLALATAGRARVIGFARNAIVHPALAGSAAFENGRAVLRRDGVAEVLFERGSLQLPGEHLHLDLLAAAAAARLQGAPVDAIARAAAAFRGLPDVLEPAGEIAGVRFVNDTKATNVDAVRKSLEAFAAPVVLILGGRYKGGDFRLLRDYVRPRAALRLKAVMAIGEARPLVNEALADVVPVVDCDSLKDAVTSGLAAAEAGEVVLLAPGCASFDMFRDYADRGAQFREAVAWLRQRVPAAGVPA